jgi:hypothetical protein
VLAAQLVLEQFGEQVMVAIPASLIIQRDDEEVGGQQPFQQDGAVGPPGHGVAQFAAQAGQDRRL